MKEVTFKLEYPLEYNESSANPIAKLTTLKLYAPSHKQLKYTVPLKQGFVSQLKASAGGNVDAIKPEDVKPMEINGDMVIFMLFSGTMDLIKYFDIFKELCLQGVVKMQNDQIITEHVLESLNPDDFERLLGEYIANFIIASLMARLQKRLTS